MIACLVVPSRAQPIVASIASVIRSDAAWSFASSSGVFTARSRSSTPVASTNRAPSSRSRSAAWASVGRNPGSMPIRAPAQPIRPSSSAAIAAAPSVPAAPGRKRGVQKG